MNQSARRLLDIPINVSLGKMLNLLFKLNINVLAPISFALTDTDQYSAMEDVYLKGRIFLDKRLY